MTVGELKILLEGVDDDTQVLVPMEPIEGFTGAFFSPCMEESKELEMGTEDLDEEEINERELLNKPLEHKPAFVLVPCGFFEEKEHTHELN
jgi:hypothetical protein